MARTKVIPSPGERIKARKAREEEWWTAKRGKHQAMYVPGLDKELREKRPHSSPEGRWGDVKTALAKKRTDRIQADVAKYKRTVPSGRALHKEGGRAGFRHGKWVRTPTPHADIDKYVSRGKETGDIRRIELSTMKVPKKKKLAAPKAARPAAAAGGRIGLKKGSNKKWIQKAVDPKHKGYCTPMTKKTCTPARKALARTFKKKAKTGWG